MKIKNQRNKGMRKRNIIDIKIEKGTNYNRKINIKEKKDKLN